MGIVKLWNTRGVAERSVDLCEKCKSLTHLKIAVSKWGHRNPNWKHGQYSAASQPTMAEKQRREKEWRQQASERMKTHNPMYSPKIRAQVSATLRNRKSQTPTGRNHWLWKGNWAHSFILRTAVKVWSRQVMQRDGFRCTRCGAKRLLEVHHETRTFAAIVDESVLAFNVAKLEDLDVNGDLFAQIRQRVVKAHTLDIGKTYCRRCHGLVDKQRRGVV